MSVGCVGEPISVSPCDMLGRTWHGEAATHTRTYTHTDVVGLEHAWIKTEMREGKKERREGKGCVRLSLVAHTHTRSDTEGSLYVPSREGGRGLTGISQQQ